MCHASEFLHLKCGRGAAITIGTQVERSRYAESMSGGRER
jgi:hypothetical protein